MVRRIIFDLDDTLIKTGEVFQSQLEAFADYVCDTFEFAEDTSRVLDIHRTRDRILRNDNDFSHDHFPNSLVSTWKLFCELADAKPRSGDLKHVRDLGWETYEIIPDPLDGMETVLDDLSGQYELVLYTMGSPEIQRPKISHYELEQWFSYIHISPHKTVETLKPVYQPYEPEHALIIGDSLRTEIKPGLEHGLSVIHRAPDKMWDFNQVPIDRDVPAVNELHEIKEHLP
jgi:putative hydrolase of the HAD superfamily